MLVPQGTTDTLLDVNRKVVNSDKIESQPSHGFDKKSVGSTV
jgi:hypothetical protein